MLLGPPVDTFEARADCRANELTLTRGRDRAVQDTPCTLLHGPIGRFLYRPLTEHGYDKPIKNLLWDHGAKYMACLELRDPFPWSGSIRYVSTVGPNSMISQPGWLAFFDLQLCSVRCGDEFGFEFN